MAYTWVKKENIHTNENLEQKNKVSADDLNFLYDKIVALETKLASVNKYNAMWLLANGKFKSQTYQNDGDRKKPSDLDFTRPFYYRLIYGLLFMTEILMYIPAMPTFGIFCAGHSKDFSLVHSNGEAIITSAGVNPRYVAYNDLGTANPSTNLSSLPNASIGTTYMFVYYQPEKEE